MPEIRINSISGGIAKSINEAGEKQYSDAVAIVPSWPAANSGNLNLFSPSEAIRPVGYSKFSVSVLNGNPYHILTNPKNTRVYSYLSTGRVISYNSVLADETSMSDLSTSVGNGAVYYNNYLYFMRDTDIDSYGPLSGGTAAFTTGVWTGAALGTQVALSDNATTYPSVRGAGTHPNHNGHVHTDGILYVCDFDKTTSTTAYRNHGLIHSIKTKFGTYEGDTNDGSGYASLVLPLDYRPIALESYGTFLAVLCNRVAGSKVLNQGFPALFFWDPTGPDPDAEAIVPLPVQYVTAIKNVNNRLYLFGGPEPSSNLGFVLFRYEEGGGVTEIHRFYDGCSPLQGAVDVMGEELVFGSVKSDNLPSAGAWSYNTRTGAIHHIASSTASTTSTDGIVTALRFAEMGSLGRPRMVLGWRDSSSYGLDKFATGATLSSYWLSARYNIGRPFKITKIIFNLNQAVASSMSIQPSIYYNSFISSKSLTLIDSTNYANGERQIIQYPNVVGKKDFMLKLEFTGSVLLTLEMPIIIEYELLDAT